MPTHSRARVKRIAALNDKLRREPTNRSLGQVLVTAAVAAEGDAFLGPVHSALSALRPKHFKKGNALCPARDFNLFQVGTRLMFFKVHYCAKTDLRRPSDDPANPAQTERILVIMFAHT